EAVAVPLLEQLAGFRVEIPDGLEEPQPLDRIGGLGVEGEVEDVGTEEGGRRGQTVAGTSGQVRRNVDQAVLTGQVLVSRQVVLLVQPSWLLDVVRNLDEAPEMLECVLDLAGGDVGLEGSVATAKLVEFPLDAGPDFILHVVDRPLVEVTALPPPPSLFPKF